MFYEFKHFGLSDHFCRETGENFSFPMHLHRAYELVAVTSGRMTVTVDGAGYVLNAGDCLLIFPNQIHSFASDVSRHVLFIFSPEVVGFFNKKRMGQIPRSNTVRLTDRAFEELMALGEDSSELKRKGVLYSLLADFDQSAEYVSRGKNERGLLYKIFDYVEKNYVEECSLHSLAEGLSYGYSYLCRFFKQSVGMSYSSYVNMYRISKSCYLLKGTERSVLSCSMECGYTSLRSFNRNFKLYTGVTPGEYRRL